MKKIFFPVVLLGAVSLASCSDDDEKIIIPELTIEAEGLNSIKDLDMPQEDTLRFKAAVSNLENYTISWKLNDEEVSTDSVFVFVPQNMGTHVISATVTGVDGGTTTSPNIEVDVYGKYKHGTFILNEGNMSDETGTLVFISPKGVVTDSAYFKANNSLLGNASQDLFINDDKIYFISQNGPQNGGEGHLIIANAETLKKELVFVDEKKELDWPSHLAVVDQTVYIRDNKGVHTFDPSTKTITFVKGTDRAAKNRMAVADDKVFVSAGKNLLVLEAGKMTQKIEMPGSISGVIKADDDNLWVSCTTNPAQICKVDAKTCSIAKKNELGDAKVGAGWGATPGISAKGDTIYFSNAGSVISRHIFNQNKTEKLIDVKEFLPQGEAGVVYNNLGVDPVSGEVYFNTLKGYSDYKVNHISVFDFENMSSPLKADYKNHTSFPAGVFFTEYFD